MRTASLLALSLGLFIIGCSSGPAITPTDYPGMLFDRRGDQIALWRQLGEYHNYHPGVRERTQIDLLVAPKEQRRQRVRLFGYARPNSEGTARTPEFYMMSPEEAVRFATQLDAYAEGLDRKRDDMPEIRLGTKRVRYDDDRLVWSRARVEYTRYTHRAVVSMTWGPGFAPDPVDYDQHSAFVELNAAQIRGLAQALRNAAGMANG